MPIPRSVSVPGSGMGSAVRTMLSRPLLLSVGGSRLKKPTVVDVPAPAVNVVINCIQFMGWGSPGAGGVLLLLVKLPTAMLLICNCTVLVVPKTPVGSDTFPTQNDKSYVVPRVVGTVCATPSN